MRIKAEDRSIKSRCLLVIAGQYCFRRWFKENAIFLTQYFSHGKDELDAGIYQSTGSSLFFFSKVSILASTQI